MSGLYIRKFIDKVQQAELRGQKDFICPIADAKNLHKDITLLLLDIDTLRKTQESNDTIELAVTGGDF